MREKQSFVIRGDVAQLVERLLCKQDVAGSTPVISTIKNRHIDLAAFLLTIA